jgi:hypothetical protein
LGGAVSWLRHGTAVVVNSVSRGVGSARRPRHHVLVTLPSAATANSILITIDFQANLWSARIMLARGQAVNQPAAALRDVKLSCGPPFAGHRGLRGGDRALHLPDRLDAGEHRGMIQLCGGCSHPHPLYGGQLEPHLCAAPDAVRLLRSRYHSSVLLGWPAAETEELLDRLLVQTETMPIEEFDPADLPQSFHPYFLGCTRDLFGDLQNEEHDALFLGNRWRTGIPRTGQDARRNRSGDFGGQVPGTLVE